MTIEERARSSSLTVEQLLEAAWVLGVVIDTRFVEKPPSTVGKPPSKNEHFHEALAA